MEKKPQNLEAVVVIVPLAQKAVAAQKNRNLKIQIMLKLCLYIR